MKKILLALLLSTNLAAQTAVKPLKIGPRGPTQIDSLVEYLDGKGLCFEASCAVRIEKSGTQAGYVDDGDPFVAFDDVAEAAFAARYTLTFQHNGTVGNGTFYGYSNLLPGDATPVLIPVDSILKGYSFSNRNAGADYTLTFRKNTTVGAGFYTISQTNTQFFTATIPDESFNAGDQIYIQHGDDGTNTVDAAIVIFLQVVP